MNHDEYLAEINTRYAQYPPDRAGRLSDNVEVVECCFGLAGETGEVIDLIKKQWTYGQVIDDSKLLNELGDVYHYFSRLVMLYGFTMEDVRKANSDKLKARYPLGYTDEAAINKVDQKAEK